MFQLRRHRLASSSLNGAYTSRPPRIGSTRAKIGAESGANDAQDSRSTTTGNGTLDVHRASSSNVRTAAPAGSNSAVASSRISSQNGHEVSTTSAMRVSPSENTGGRY